MKMPMTANHWPWRWESPRQSQWRSRVTTAMTTPMTGIDNDGENHRGSGRDGHSDNDSGNDSASDWQWQWQSPQRWQWRSQLRRRWQWQCHCRNSDNQWQWQEYRVCSILRNGLLCSQGYHSSVMPCGLTCPLLLQMFCSASLHSPVLLRLRASSAILWLSWQTIPPRPAQRGVSVVQILLILLKFSYCIM